MLGKLGLLPISLQVYLLHTPVRNAVGLGDREEAGLRLRYSIKIASISVLQLFDCQFCGSLHMMNMMSFGWPGREIVMRLSSLAHGHATLDQLFPFIVHASMTICNCTIKMKWLWKNLLKLVVSSALHPRSPAHASHRLDSAAAPACSLCLGEGTSLLFDFSLWTGWALRTPRVSRVVWIRLHIQLETMSNDYHIFPPTSRFIRYNKQPSAL